MTRARQEQICASDTPYYHCIARCVRRAFLCGEDEFSGQSFEHRRQWIVERLTLLDQMFADKRGHPENKQNTTKGDTHKISNP